jgi:hypothetical protein
MRKILFSISAAALSLYPSVTLADDVTDFYFQQVTERYFRVPQTARTFAMGGSSVVTSSDSSSIWGNPAGLGFMQGGELSGTYGYDRVSGDEYPTGRSIEQQSHTGSGMLALPLGPVMEDTPHFGNLGVGWSQSSGRWNDDSFDTLTRREQVALSYAYAITPEVSAGYGLAWTRDKIQSKAIFDYPMGDGFRHTVGAGWRPTSDWSFGATTFVGYGEHHALYGPGIKGETDTFEVGTEVGAQYELDRTLLSGGIGYRHLSSDGEVESSIPQNFVGGDEVGNIFDVRLGAEHALAERFVARAGYRFAGLARYKYNRTELNDLNGSAYYHAISGGLGYVFPLSSDYLDSINLDYGVEYRAVGRGDWEHLVTLSVPFSFCEKADA